METETSGSYYNTSTDQLTLVSYDRSVLREVGRMKVRMKVSQTVIRAWQVMQSVGSRPLNDRVKYKDISHLSSSECCR